MRRRRHVIAAVAVLALVAGACTRAEGETEIGGAVGAPAEGGERAGEGTPATGSRLDQGGFGDLEEVCSEGEPGSATETGLTADEIRLGTVTDRGSVERPGLTQEMYDTAVAFAAWCNEHGGIGGRSVVIDDLDAKLFEYGQRIGDACQQDFALVGGGGVFDAQDNGARVACGLVNIPWVRRHPPGTRRRAAGAARAQSRLLVRLRRVPVDPGAVPGGRQARHPVGQPRRWASGNVVELTDDYGAPKPAA